MDGVAPPSNERSQRARLIDVALRLVTVSVAWGALSGGLSVAAGLLGHSLGVLGLGLTVLADLVGSVIVMWRFRAERGHPISHGRFEVRAALVVAVSLGLTSIVLTVDAVHALLIGSRPGMSDLSLVIAGASLVVLAPLAFAKRRVGAALASRALKGDGTLSAVGASTALLALVSLVLYRELGLWWTDRVAALLIAAVAGVEAFRTARRD